MEQTHRLEYREATRAGQVNTAWCTGCTWEAAGRKLTRQQAEDHYDLHRQHMEESRARA